MPRLQTQSKLAYLGVTMALVLGSFVPELASAGVQIESETLFRWYQREKSGGNEQAVLPVYEYLRVGAGNLEGDGLSLHAYGWGRYDLVSSDAFNDPAQGEVLYGYLQFRSTARNYLARLGRQTVFTGVSNECVDGLRFSAGITPELSVDLYGGQPVALEEVDGRDGDGIVGGRIGHHWGSHYNLGLSYKRVGNDGNKEEEVLGIDSFLNLPYGISISGFSTQNMISGGWAEHSYELNFAWKTLLVRPALHRFRYGDYFDTGKNSAGPFRFLTDSNEIVTQIGGDVSWAPFKWLDLRLILNSYDYRKREDTAEYYGGAVTVHGAGRTQVGGELGRMQGATKDTRYTQARGFFFWERAPLFVSGDAIYVSYDEEIMDMDHSLFGSLGAGASFLKKSLEVKVSADASSDPYFDSDLRGMLSIRYLFDSESQNKTGAKP